MKNFFVLTDAIDFIEKNLREPVTQEEVANYCYCSLSSLQKLFRHAFHMSLGEYITKRRITCSARELVSTDAGITKIALRFGYNSPEVFCRAFRRVWGMTPSKFRTKRRFTEIFPKFEFDMRSDFPVMRKFDISELFDVLSQMKGKYVICFDIRHMMEINNISREHGDAAIVECLHRIEKAAGDDMFLFRIGGDEFALVTNRSSKDDVIKTAESVLSQNRNPLTVNNISVNVSLRAAAVRLDMGHIRYSDLFANLRNVINQAKVPEKGETLIFVE